VVRGLSGRTLCGPSSSNVAFTSTTNAFSTAGCYFNCSKSGLGNNATGTSKVSVTDSQGNPVTLAAARTVTITQTGTGTLTPTNPSLTIAIGASESSASFTWTEGNGNYNDTVTAASSGLTSVTATLSH
jgi:ABC-type Fe3+-hydroxamate transport system substrate-binding protein